MGSFILLLLITLIVGIFPLTIYLIKTLNTPKKNEPTLDSELIDERKGNASQQWWEDQRSRYNTGLLYAGLIAFGLYLISLFIIFQPTSFLNAKDLFSFLFIAISYLIYMGVANLFYNLGPIAEALIKPKNVVTFRTRFFNIGYWLSVLLPFIALLGTWMDIGIFRSLWYNF